MALVSNSSWKLSVYCSGLLQAHVVQAFEQSLGNMTARLQQLQSRSEQKDSELTDMKSTIDNLRRMTGLAHTEILQTSQNQALNLHSSVGHHGQFTTPSLLSLLLITPSLTSMLLLLLYLSRNVLGHENVINGNKELMWKYFCDFSKKQQIVFT